VLSFILDLLTNWSRESGDSCVTMVALIQSTWYQLEVHWHYC